jgi:hypothetical protein
MKPCEIDEIGDFEDLRGTQEALQSLRGTDTIPGEEFNTEVSLCPMAVIAICR